MTYLSTLSKLDCWTGDVERDLGTGCYGGVSERTEVSVKQTYLADGVR